MIDKELHIHPQWNRCMIPLPPRLVQGENAKSVRFRMLLNFHSFL